MWMTPGDLSLDDREMAAGSHELYGLSPDSKPDDDTITGVPWVMGIYCIGKKHLHQMDHRLLARPFMVQMWYDSQSQYRYQTNSNTSYASL